MFSFFLPGRSHDFNGDHDEQRRDQGGVHLQPDGSHFQQQTADQRADDAGGRKPGARPAHRGGDRRAPR
jgi:hypothetical protein